MSVPHGIATFIARLHHTLRHETADWQLAHQEALQQMRQADIVAERALRHQLHLMHVRFTEERRRLTMEEERSTQHFSEFLDSIDAIKTTMLAYYADMPRSLALRIHHHATELLTEAWHNPSPRERLKTQTRFTELMLTITDDLARLEREGNRQALPEKTLALIQKNRRQLPPA